MNTIVAETIVTTELSEWIEQLRDLREQSILPISHDDSRITILREAWQKRYQHDAEPLDFDDNFRGRAYFADVVLPAHSLPPIATPAWAERIWMYAPTDLDTELMFAATVQIEHVEGYVDLTAEWLIDLETGKVEELPVDVKLTPVGENVEDMIHIPAAELRSFAALVASAIKTVGE